MGPLQIPHAFEGAFVLGCLVLTAVSAVLVLVTRAFIGLAQFVQDHEGLMSVWSALNS